MEEFGTLFLAGDLFQAVLESAHGDLLACDSAVASETLRRRCGVLERSLKLVLLFSCESLDAGVLQHRADFVE